MLGSIFRFSVAVVTAGNLVAQPPRYILHDLGSLQGSEQTFERAVTGINIKGQVVGWEILPDGQVRSFRTAPNAPIDWSTDNLGSLGGTITRARGINASGQVVGESTLSTGELRGFRTTPNSPIHVATDNLGTLRGDGSLVTQAYAINDSGQVTGISGSKYFGHPFLTAPNSPINPSTDDIYLQLGQSSSSSTGYYINNRGHVLGAISGSALYPRAFLHTDRVSVSFPGFLRYVGEYFAGLTEYDHFVYAREGHLSVLRNNGAAAIGNCNAVCLPLGVNNSLQVVGVTNTNPFLFTGGNIYDLNTLIQNGSGWELPRGTSLVTWLLINDAGQIALMATFNNEMHAVRLDPVPSAANAIQQALTMVHSLHLGLGRKSTVPAMLKLSLASKLKGALDASSRSSPGATRGLLNEFENIVRAQDGVSLTHDQANRLLEMAEAAIAMT